MPDGALVVDLSATEAVTVDPETRSVGRGSRARSAEDGGPPGRLWFARAPEVTLLEGVTHVRRYAENVAEVLLNGLSLSNWSSAASAQSPAPEPTSWPLAVKVTSMFPRVAFE
jgi:hypothetical protein